MRTFIYSLFFISLTTVNLSLLSDTRTSSFSETIASKLLKGDYKSSLEFYNESAFKDKSPELKPVLQDLSNTDTIILSSFKVDVGKEISIQIKRKKNRIIVKKIKKEIWRKWNQAFSRELLKKQKKDGSWGIPAKKVAAGGHGESMFKGNDIPVYATTLSCLMLESYYRHPANLK